MQPKFSDVPEGPPAEAAVLPAGSVGGAPTAATCSVARQARLWRAGGMGFIRVLLDRLVKGLVGGATKKKPTPTGDVVQVHQFRIL